MGAVCSATSEYSQSMSCEMALDGITHMMGEWASSNSGAGTKFSVINRTPHHEISFYFCKHVIRNNPHGLNLRHSYAMYCTAMDVLLEDGIFFTIHVA